MKARVKRLLLAVMEVRAAKLLLRRKARPPKRSKNLKGFRLLSVFAHPGLPKRFRCPFAACGAWLQSTSAR